MAFAGSLLAAVIRKRRTPTGCRNSTHGRPPNIWPQACEAPISTPKSINHELHRPLPNPHSTAHNAAQTAYTRPYRPSNHNLHTRAIHQINKQRRCTRYSPGHMEQIRFQDTTARKATRHIHGIPDSCGRAAILLCSACWQLCTYTPFLATSHKCTTSCFPSCMQKLRPRERSMRASKYNC